MKDERWWGRRRLWAAALGALCAYLSAETLLPPAQQPTALACLAAIRGYQAVGAPAMADAGVRCRYTPTCSHYAVAALSHYGAMEGLARTAGRLWRCSPWGGVGHDPAVASLVFVPRQETPEEKKAREDAERRMREDQKKALEDFNKARDEVKKAWDQAAPEAGKAAGACAAGCVISILVSLIGFAVWVIALIYVVKDAKSRGDANAVLWIVLAVFFPLIGLVIYFVARPKGDLVPCANCKNRRLITLVKCPHCGADAAGGAKA